MINIVEPTLVDQAGHCYSFVQSFCAARGDAKLRLWVGRDAQVDFGAGLDLKRYFFRKLRRFQAFALYRKLLASGEKILIATAGRTDLALLAWAARGGIPARRVYLYFHWLNVDAKKQAFLRDMARRLPTIEIIGPTQTVVAQFKKAGFAHTNVVPYPITQRNSDRHPDSAAAFTRVLYAGAARQDKGFRHVVDLVELLAEQDSTLPVALQTSAQHYGKYDASTRDDLARLDAIAYVPLTRYADTLSPEEYDAQFAGAICLQLYDVAAFADRISGVTLDALSNGSPVVTTAGTWIARTVERFKAGIVVRDTAPATLQQAVEVIRADFGAYSARARAGGQRLQQEHSATQLFDVVARA